MKIQVRLYGPLQQYRPRDAPGTGRFSLEVTEDMTVGRLAELLNLPPAGARYAFVNDQPSPPERLLNPDDLVVFAPPMGGGE